MRACWWILVLTGLLIGPAASRAAGPGDPWAWWLTPLSGAGEHHLAVGTAWHARLMVFAWGFLLPLGALTARFFKVMPGQDWPNQLDNKAWWHAHRTLQYTGVAAMCVGLVLAWGIGGRGGTVVRVHGWMGWGLCLAAGLQVAGGLARGSKGGPTDRGLRGDHYDMTAWRLAFERGHKSLGWVAVVVAIAAMALGLVAADAPRWMAVVLSLWWLALAGLFIGLQRQGRCIDTYQAIWGPDPAHPGSQQAAIGWGVRRYTAAGWRARFGPR